MQFPSSAVVEDLMAAEDAAAREELSDVIEGVEALLDAYAAGVIDLCPGLERLLLDVLELATAHATEAQYSSSARSGL